MIRKISSSHWTAVAIGIALLLLHAFWFIRSDRRADVISGFGVSIADLGILVTAQPFIRRGIRKTARQQFNLTSEERMKEIRDQADELEDLAVRHVLKERVAGVILVAVGTLFNGYAGALARLVS